MMNYIDDNWDYSVIYWCIGMAILDIKTHKVYISEGAVMCLN